MIFRLILHMFYAEEQKYPCWASQRLQNAPSPVGHLRSVPTPDQLGNERTLDNPLNDQSRVGFVRVVDQNVITQGHN